MEEQAFFGQGIEPFLSIRRLAGFAEFGFNEQNGLPQRTDRFRESFSVHVVRVDEECNGGMVRR
jgi:hypothetical protein